MAQPKVMNFQAYGGCLELWNYRGHEVLLAGGADTGKTMTCLMKIDAMCRLYPGAHMLLVRRHRSDMKDTVVQSLVENVWGGNEEDVAVRRIGGVNPIEFHYHNGSIIRLRGMDDGSKALGGEYDMIFVSQAEELSESNWNTLCTRATGRSGITPYPQILADANPGPPNHFLINRNSLHVIKALHVHNPTIYDQDTGDMLSESKLRMDALLALTGIERRRLLHGEWCAAEGLIYDDFLTQAHVTPSLPKGKARLLAIDFGFRHPIVCQWWHVDPNDRMTMTREFYYTDFIVEDLARIIQHFTKRGGEYITDIICDHDAEDRATLERHLGMSTTPALKGPNSIRAGIDMVKARLRARLNDKPMLQFHQDALLSVDAVLRERRWPISTENEFGLYAWEGDYSG